MRLRTGVGSLETMKTRKRKIEFVTYLVGVFVLGLFYSQLKASIPPLLVLASVIAWLLALRVLGAFIRKRVFHGSQNE
jgi:predicted RND superfamily exporter protein